MYNGIGLATPRGSGTSGHVQSNVALARARSQMRRLAEVKAKVTGAAAAKAIAERPANPDIVAHEVKRRVEVKLAELRDSLEGAGVADDEVEARVATARAELTARLTAPAPGGGAAASTAGASAWARHAREAAAAGAGTDSHMRAVAKAREDARLRSAFGITTAYSSGDAFNEEVQVRRRPTSSAAVPCLRHCPVRR